MTRISANPSPPVAHTWGAIPQKGKAQVVDEGKSKVVDKSKSKVVDKGKGKLIKPEKPKKPEFIRLQIGEAFKIYEPKDTTPPAPPDTESGKTSSTVKRESVETPPRIAKVLKLVDEEGDLEVQQPLEAASV